MMQFYKCASFCEYTLCLDQLFISTVYINCLYQLSFYLSIQQDASELDKNMRLDKIKKYNINQNLNLNIYIAIKFMETQSYLKLNVLTVKPIFYLIGSY